MYALSKTIGGFAIGIYISSQLSTIKEFHETRIEQKKEIIECLNSSIRKPDTQDIFNKQL